ncbi:hypothetical protein ACSYAD_12965 [Acaryochloris marina NIES-2412]|uniref:hypothetical protein n=1 Tax=Acaryochloris marina TaxID=155978 RepID=UPI00405877AD
MLIGIRRLRESGSRKDISGFEYHFCSATDVDEATAKLAQLMMEYDPQPPFQAGSPEQAGEILTTQLLEVGKPLIDAFRLQIQ